jgi:hypothetical protein
MPKYPPQARFEILASRRLGLDRCEFDVRLVEGSLRNRDLFQISERGTLWEWVILKFSRHNDDRFTILCMNWVGRDSVFVGEFATSRAMKAVECKRYKKHLKDAEQAAT